MIPKWLTWAKELQSLAQSGLNYTENPFEIERYNAILKISAEIMAEYSDVNTEKILDLFSMQNGHSTPKVDVRGVAFRNGKVLMVKEKMDGGRWTLPGGWADPNETPSGAAERELFEESGFTSNAVRLLAVYDRDKQGHWPPFPFHVYKLFFLCELSGGKETVSHETEEVRFFAENEIPELSRARVTERQLQRFFQMHKTGKWEIEFD